MALQEEFAEAKGGIPIGFLHVEYQLFRGDLAGIMGKQKEEPHSTDAQSTRYPSQSPLNPQRLFPAGLLHRRVCGHAMHAQSTEHLRG